MKIIYKLILGVFLVTTALTSPLYARTDVHIGVGLGVPVYPQPVYPPPLYYPSPEFPYEGGYFVTYGRRYYYHYDPWCDCWHYGRNYREYEHEEQRRAHGHGHHYGWHHDD